ncbi:MAG: hypothetical protein HFH94_13270 [Lachnospiraceae bacterium]|jgi:O-antigen/teichoic acid export membrane protein|nr:oligosaccharide flippase family protein [uncultured Acetatifactor sp.]MCI9220688.1 hypothetical protein [Lachnospiraceae bacterium]
MDRKKLAVKSSMIGLGSKLLAAMLAFISRKIFLQCLGKDLLGINGTLSQVLDTLSLTELGFQTTIIFQLYKPLAKNDYVAVSQILMLLRRLYFLIGIIILVVGMASSPILKYIITKVDVDFSTVYIVYFIMLLGTAASYLLSYNKALLQADQKMYVINLIDSLLQIVSTVAKIMCMVVYKSFILYAVIGAACTVGGNLLSFMYYKRNYGWIDKKANADKLLRSTLLRNTKDVFLGRIGGYVYASTDNLVISSFVGTSWVGLVGNYTTIVAAVKMVLFGLTSPIQPMLGNYAVSKSREETLKTMNNYGFIRFALSVFLLIPTLCLSDMFVGLFYGDQFVLQPVIAVLLTADLFIICMQGAVGELIDALGYFRQERNLYIVYAVMNICLSIVGAVMWGVVPVFAATVISQTVGWVWRSIIAYRHYFRSRKMFVAYWKRQAQYSVFFIAMSVSILGLKEAIKLPFSIIGFLGYGMIAEIVTGAAFIFLYRKKAEFVYLKSLISRLIPKR